MRLRSARLLAALLLVGGSSALAQTADALPFEVSLGGLAARSASPVANIDVQQFATDLRVSWSPRPGLSLVLRGQWSASATQTDVRGDMVRADVGPPGPPDQRWGVLVGTDITLAAGTLSVGSGEAPFQFVLPAALGAGRYDIALAPAGIQPDGSARPAVFGDAGWRLAGSVGIAMQALLWRRFIVRLEVGDTISPTRVSQVNGCGAGDLRLMDDAVRGGREPDSLTPGSLSQSCQVGTFSGVDPETQLRGSNAVPLALNVTRSPSNELLHLVSVRLGVGVRF